MIEVVNLVKKYGNRLALDNISFNIKPGEIIGFLGPNGAGKSSTMNIITGYLSANSGYVKIDGIDILDDPINAKRKIGYLPETPPLYMDMKVNEYLNFVFDLKKIKKNRHTHLAQISDMVKLSDVKNRVIKNLSKGYRQRVGLAQALIGDPPIIILDEPSVGLDPKQIIEIRNLIKNLGKEHTVILSSHILSEIQAVCDRVIIINKGKIVLNQLTDNLNSEISGNLEISLEVIGDKNQVYEILSELPQIENINIVNHSSGPFDSSLFIIKPKSGQDIRKEISQTVSKHGFIIIGLKLTGSTLEEIFMKLTDISQILPQNIDQDQTDHDITQNKNDKSISNQGEFI